MIPLECGSRSRLFPNMPIFLAAMLKEEDLGEML